MTVWLFSFYGYSFCAFKPNLPWRLKERAKRLILSLKQYGEEYKIIFSVNTHFSFITQHLFVFTAHRTWEDKNCNICYDLNHNLMTDIEHICTSAAWIYYIAFIAQGLPIEAYFISFQDKYCFLTFYHKTLIIIRCTYDSVSKFYWIKQFMDER